MVNKDNLGPLGLPEWLTGPQGPYMGTPSPLPSGVTWWVFTVYINKEVACCTNGPTRRPYEGDSTCNKKWIWKKEVLKYAKAVGPTSTAENATSIFKEWLDSVVNHWVVEEGGGGLRGRTVVNSGPDDPEMHPNCSTMSIVGANLRGTTFNCCEIAYVDSTVGPIQLDTNSKLFARLKASRDNMGDWVDRETLCETPPDEYPCEYDYLCSAGDTEECKGPMCACVKVLCKREMLPTCRNRDED